MEQFAGRGRQGRSWVSVPGNFFGSTLVRLRPADPLASTLSLAAGLALIEALDVAVPAQPAMLKWPNDVMLRGRKLAGILLERNEDRVAVGFGVNLASAPRLEEREVAALDAEIAPEAFAPLLAGSFARLVDAWRTSDAPLLARAWQERAHPVGTRLSVHATKDKLIAGSFIGLESDGALRVQLDDGSIEVVRSGEVDIG